MLAIIDSSEADIKLRVRDEVVRQMEEEKQLVTAMKKEEDKQLRLERIKVLQEILKKKMTASKLRDTIRMMHLMTMEDLEMEVDIVVEHAQDMMETEASYRDCDQDIEGEDTMDQGDGDDHHVKERLNYKVFLRYQQMMKCWLTVQWMSGLMTMVVEGLRVSTLPLPGGHKGLMTVLVCKI